MRRLRLAVLPAWVAIALTSAFHAHRHPTAVAPSAVIKLFDGKSLANFDTWLVDHHESDPERVFSVVDQIDGAPAIASAVRSGAGCSRNRRIATTA